MDKKITEEMIEDAELYDSRTNEWVSADDLGISDRAYRDAIRKSFECDQPEGHICVNGRRVFAMAD